jgi:hypothetical protein
MRVVERRNGACFTLKASSILMIMLIAQGQHLDGDLSLQARVLGQPGFACIATSNAADQVIASRCLASLLILIEFFAFLHSNLP